MVDAMSERLRILHGEPPAQEQPAHRSARGVHGERFMDQGQAEKQARLRALNEEQSRGIYSDTLDMPDKGNSISASTVGIEALETEFRKTSQDHNMNR